MSRLIEQLKKGKNTAAFGAISHSEKGKARDRLMHAIGHSEKATLGAFDWVAFLRWNTREFVSMPATVMATFLVLAFGGWMTSVSAAGSLPGDTLYRVKLVTEQAQLRFASAEHRAILHTEFAERRLAEAAALEELNDPARLVYVSDTISAFRKELTAAESQLRRMKEEGSTTQALQTGNTVDQKIEAMSATLEETAAVKPDSSSAKEAQVVAKEAEDSLVDVMVETHEHSVDPEGSHREMKFLFRDKLMELQDRERFNLGRVAVMEAVLHKTPVENVTPENVLVFEQKIAEAIEPMAEAERLAAAGGYRAAFDLLKDVSNNLLSVERQIVEVENTIIAAQQVEEESPEPESEEPADEVIKEESIPDSGSSENEE